jgi:hypothetical protein
MLERTIEAYLVKRVKAIGGEVRKIRFLDRHGAPDRLVMTPMWTVWVELKAPGKVAKPHQAREHDRLRRMNQRAVVIDSMTGVDALIEGTL